MLLTFRPESLDRMREGKKRTTIRRNPLRWEKWFLGCIEREEMPWLQVYEGNPRNGGKKVCETELDLFAISKGRDFNLIDAHEDGFLTVGGLLRALSKLYRMTLGEVRFAEWAILSPNMGPIYASFGMTDPGREWPIESSSH